MTKLLRWFPWRYVVSRVARARGLVDPIKVLSRLESFAQPLEVKEPLELLRAGMVFHARGLLNTSAIQHNLDWIWPYWVERQYDPEDESFIPRAFSITHVNLTHRNWTGFGLPDVDQIPIVDPRGLVTPFWDGWSLDAWVLADDGRRLVPSRLLPTERDDQRVEQRLLCCEGGGDHAVGAMAVVTSVAHEGLELESRAEVVLDQEQPTLLLTHRAAADGPGWLVVALRPYNPEGVSFVHRLALDPDRTGWTVDRKRSVRFDSVAEVHRFSTYREGDAYLRLPEQGERQEVECDVGMANAAALFRIESPRAGADGGTDAPGSRQVRVAMALRSRAELRRWPPLLGKRATRTGPGRDPEAASWARALDGHCRLETAHEPTRFLYDAAVRSVVLHAPGEDVYPGPFTYKRFWFRDAAFILHALACLGLFDRARRVLESYPSRQKRDGFFLSQEGEWDSNGEALWILERTCTLSGRWLEEPWRHAIERGARWIAGKRLPERGDDGATAHAGLLPAGFSAEHLGPNDYYYWDDFWGVAGLRSAARLLEHMGVVDTARELRREADDLMGAIDRSVAHAVERLGAPAIPASPYRRLDSGAIGSLAASYPLALWAPDDPRMLGTTDYLVRECLVDGGFFQDVIHSGINPYLTLHLAQALLRAGDPLRLDQARSLVRAVMRLATSTGQWPEAIHPRTKGGCMGDGHHVWAAAEWIVAVRNAIVREETCDATGDRLVLASGVLPEWLDAGELTFGPAPTPWGPVSVRLTPRRDGVEVAWTGAWRSEPPTVEVQLPGTRAEDLPARVVGDGAVTVPLRTWTDATVAPVGEPVRAP